MLFKEIPGQGSDYQLIRKLAIASLGLILCFSQICSADLADLKVYSPIVNKGEMGIEILGNTTFDDDDEADGFQYHELEFEMGVTDWWATSFTASLIKFPEEDIKFNIIGWEITFQFTEDGKYWLNTGVHLELEFDDENDEPNNFEVRVLFEKNIATYQHTFNINFEQECGHFRIL